MQEIGCLELKQHVQNKAFIIDSRPTNIFSDGFVRGAVNIIFNKNFEPRAEYFSKEENELILILQQEDIPQLEKLGEPFKNRIAFFHVADLDAWKQHNIPLDLLINVDAYELKLDITHDDKAIVIDVRPEIQYQDEHIVGAVNMPVSQFNDPAKIGMLDEHHNLYLHCNGGTASVLIASILKRNGFHNIRNIEGGLRAIKEDGSVPLKTDNKKNLFIIV